jgi:hypothetical protein
VKLYEFLLACAALVTALSIIGGGVVWLVWPRIRAAIENVARGVTRLEEKLGDKPDTVGRYAKVAAGAASDLPQIKRDVEAIAKSQEGLTKWRERTERRLTALEGILLALMGPELHKRIKDSEIEWPEGPDLS